MKQYIIPALAAVLVSFSSSASDGVSGTGDARYSLTVGQLTMVVDANRGGKVLSFRYGEKEILSQMTMPNSYGSTFWTSPQKEWNWPPVQEFDSKPYSVSEEESSLILTSEFSERMGCRIIKRCSADSAKGCIRIRYTIVNESGAEKKVAPWEITRVLNAGVFFAEASEEDIFSAEGRNPVKFVQENGASWYQFDAVSEQRKSNIDGRGWYAYANGELLLVKTFPDIDASQSAPEEAEIQVYVNNGKTFAELEAQGAYTSLGDGESLDWETEWYLIPCELPAEPSEALIKKVNETIK